MGSSVQAWHYYRKRKNKLGNTTTAIRTSGKEHSILLAVDKQSIAANGKDVLHVTAQLTDKKVIL